MKSAGLIDGPLQAAVYKRIMEDPEIRSILAANVPADNSTLPEDRMASFVPITAAPLPNMPYLTYQNTGESQLDRILSGAFFVIRCYNSLQEDYVLINRCLSRVKVLLDRHSFRLEGFTVIELRCVNSGAELTDQGYNQNFRELTFQTSYL